MKKRVGRKDRACGEVVSIPGPGHGIIANSRNLLGGVVPHTDHRLTVESGNKARKPLLPEKVLCSLNKSGVQFHSTLSVRT